MEHDGTGRERGTGAIPTAGGGPWGDEHRRALLDCLAAGTPGLVLLDLGMPEMDGYEVARRIRPARAGSGPSSSRSPAGVGTGRATAVGWPASTITW